MLTLDVNLLLCRDDNSSALAVQSLHEAYLSEGIKKFLSVSSANYELFFKKYSKYKDLNFLINDSTDCYEHMQKISLRSKADYIMFLHDDDLFGKELLVQNFEILKAQKPIAMSSRPTFINFESKKYNGFQYKYEKKIYNRNFYFSLAEYFLPFIQPVFFPTTVFSNQILKEYFIKNNQRMGVHEDVKIIIYFISRGNFLEHKMNDLYFYRWHDSQSSNHKDKEGDRLLLIKWLKKLRINFIYKSILIFFAYYQFFLFIKKIEPTENKFLSLLYKLRRKIILYRRGGKVID